MKAKPINNPRKVITWRIDEIVIKLIKKLASKEKKSESEIIEAAIKEHSNKL